MDRLNYKKRIFVVISAAVFVIAAPSILFYVYGNIGLQVASIVISGLLSLALVVLYFQQYNVLDRQTELMEQEFESQITYRRQITAEGDTVYINLGNMGRGAVQFVDLKSEIVSDSGPISAKPGHDQLSAVENRSKFISGFCDVKEFEGKVQMLPTDDGDSYYPFRYFSNRLVAAGIEKCTIRLTLEIFDEMQQKDEDSDEFKIAEQELDLGGIIEREIELENGETQTIETVQSNSLSETIKGPMNLQDIIPRDSPLFD